MTTFEKFCKNLEETVKQSYEQNITMEQAEKLAGEFLYAMMVVSAELRKADLDSRMRKQGVKAIRGAVYIEAATKPEKKPTEAALAAIVDTDRIVQGEQKSYDEAEVLSSDVERTYNICREAHIYFRGIAKGSMG